MSPLDLCDSAEPPARLRRLLRLHHAVLHQGMSSSQLAWLFLANEQLHRLQL